MGSADAGGSALDDKRFLEGAGLHALVRRIAHPARRELPRRRGEVVTLLGRNGAGRTTTLRAIMGLTGSRKAR